MSSTILNIFSSRKKNLEPIDYIATFKIRGDSLRLETRLGRLYIAWRDNLFLSQKGTILYRAGRDWFFESANSGLVHA